MKLYVNEQSICNLYRLHSDNEQYATVGVLKYLINSRDGINDIDYFNYDDIIDELELIYMCYIHLYSFIFCYFLYIVFYDVTRLYFICSIVLRVRNKGD